MSHICRNTILLNVKCAFLEDGVVLLFVSCYLLIFLVQDRVAFTRDPGPQLFYFPKVCESKLSWIRSWLKQRAVNSLMALLDKGVAVTCGGQGLLRGTPGVLSPCDCWAGVAERVVVTTSWCHWSDIFSFLCTLVDPYCLHSVEPPMVTQRSADLSVYWCSPLNVEVCVSV